MFGNLSPEPREERGQEVPTAVSSAPLREGEAAVELWLRGGGCVQSEGDPEGWLCGKQGLPWGPGVPWGRRPVFLWVLGRGQRALEGEAERRG